MDHLGFTEWSAPTVGPVPTTYHHGDLAVALRATTVELITERGPSGFSLREVARRAGVSHAAPAHHFGDARGLLTSVAVEGFGLLADGLATGTEGIDDAAERLAACGRAYVGVVLHHPGHFAVVFQADLISEHDPSYVEGRDRVNEQFVRTITMVRDQLHPTLDVELGATLVWATLQGLLLLAPNLGALVRITKGDSQRVDELRDELVDRFTAVLMNGLAAH